MTALEAADIDAAIEIGAEVEAEAGDGDGHGKRAMAVDGGHWG